MDNRDILNSNEENKSRNKKKTVDEKIEELKEKLKLAELEKKKNIEKKGKNLWVKIKYLFLEDEKIVDNILKDPNKLENLKQNLTKFLEKEKLLLQGENK